MRATPNPANKSDMVTIELGESKTANAVRSVVVTNMNGKTISRQQVVNGEKKIRVQIGNASGVYNCTICENGQPTETCKIIVK